MQSIRVCERISVAPSWSFCPRRMEAMVEPPAETSVQKAMTRFIMGKLTASPAMAMAPTPCPMKMLSMMLYSEVTVMPMMAGMEYCNSSFPTGSEPNICGLFLLIRYRGLVG